MSTNRVEEARCKLQRASLKLTPQRIAVLSYLLDTDQHPTVDDIYQALDKRFPNISPATIYNNLNVLCENKLVRELTFANAPNRYDGDTTNHYHIICTHCDILIDFHYPIFKEVEKLAEQRTKFTISHHRFDLYGICQRCKEDAI